MNRLLSSISCSKKDSSWLTLLDRAPKFIEVLFEEHIFKHANILQFAVQDFSVYSEVLHILALRTQQRTERWFRTSETAAKLTIFFVVSIFALQKEKKRYDVCQQKRKRLNHGLNTLVQKKKLAQKSIHMQQFISTASRNFNHYPSTRVALCRAYQSARFRLQKSEKRAQNDQEKEKRQLFRAWCHYTTKKKKKKKDKKRRMFSSENRQGM